MRADDDDNEHVLLPKIARAVVGVMASLHVESLDISPCWCAMFLWQFTCVRSKVDVMLHERCDVTHTCWENGKRRD